MTSTRDFEHYLERFRFRLKRLALWRGLSLLSLAALLITVIAVAVAIRRGFPADLMLIARVLLFGSLAAIALLLVVRPARRIGTDQIEARTPAFGGRVATWAGIQGHAHPLAELLAEDSLRVAAAHPPENEVPKREFAGAVAVTGVAAAALLFLAIAGPGNYAYGVRHLWLGWAWPGLLPPQSIEVLPGDDGIRMGGTVAVRANMRGFDPAEAFVHARFGDGEWQQVEMADLDDRFEFTFFSVRQPLEYFVSAANNRSETFLVNVVDLPVIERLTATYRFPDWTGRADETQDPGGDVRAIAETEVVISVSADRPMTPGELVIGDKSIPLSVEGNAASATFTVEADNQYFVAAKVGGETIRLTDDYFITLLEDGIPKVEFARPGRDWSASSVEEVTASVRAEDDFRLESLEIRYSVNGGDWASVELPLETDADAADHVFFLESLKEDGALVPGDLVSYYAVARDRENSARTDLFFIDVQPFDRRYSQSQQSGGAMGGQGPRQDEISQRQKEIIVSTWNLIREQQEGRRGDAAYVSDNAALLARVQATLREQVETLAQRAEARQLTASADEIATFVAHLERASGAMQPAAERLAEIDLEQAVFPEQEALQHLLAAEAVFTDISVSLQSNNRGAGGGQAGRDLTEMFELEMDLEKNQYETGSRATPEPPQQQMQEAADELAELARRQEQLARNADPNRAATPAERWQQERLRRDVEELRERLERMQQQAAANSSQQGSEEGQPSSGQPGASGSTGGASSERRELDELTRRLESAARAMSEADEAMREGGSSEDRRRAAEEAGRQLAGARDRATEEAQRALEASLEELSARAKSLHETQEAMENRLQDAIRGVSIGRNDLDRLESGMSILEEYRLAEDKRQLQSQVQDLEQDAHSSAQQLEDSQPGAAAQLRAAIDKLRESEIETRISVAAAYIEQGEAVYVAASESAVTEALRELQEDLERARSMVSAGGERGEGGAARGDSVAEAIAETRQLRRELQQLAEANATRGGTANRGRDDLQQSTGRRVDDLETTGEFDLAADNISDRVLSLFREFRARGASVQDIDEIRRLAAAIRASEFSGNPELLEEEARRALATVEQLEVALAKSAKTAANGIRTSNAEQVPEAHREIVADYYRRLGSAPEEAAPE